MIISFAKTTPALLDGTKKVTRRRWAAQHARQFKAGTVHQAWDRLPRVKGSKRVALIRATADAYQEPLGKMPPEDVALEGTPATTVDEFIAFIGGTPNEVVWVCRFELVVGAAAAALAAAAAPGADP
jgi:hypothetical protein